jgi:hypothetical protein
MNTRPRRPWWRNYKPGWFVSGGGGSGGSGTVQTDGVTIQGDGSGGSKIAIKAVQVSGGLSGAGTVASPLAYDGTTQTDGVTLQGTGVTASKIALKAVQTQARLTGAGTVASKLDIAGWPVAYFAGGAGVGQSNPAVTNRVAYGGFALGYALTFATISFYLNTADGAHNCDVGIYDAAGQLVANIGAQALGSSGLNNLATIQGSQTISPGRYVFAYTSASNVLVLGADFTPVPWCSNNGTDVSAGGALPASIVAPTVAPGNRISRFSLF